MKKWITVGIVTLLVAGCSGLQDAVSESSGAISEAIDIDPLTVGALNHPSLFAQTEVVTEVSGQEVRQVDEADIREVDIVFAQPWVAYQPGNLFEDPLLGFEDPLLGFEDPLLGFEDPLLGFEDPLLGFEDPLLGYTASMVGLRPEAHWVDPTGESYPQEELVAREQTGAIVIPAPLTPRAALIISEEQRISDEYAAVTPYILPAAIAVRTLDESPDAVARFITAHIEAVSTLNENPAQYSELLRAQRIDLDERFPNGVEGLTAETLLGSGEDLAAEYEEDVQDLTATLGEASEQVSQAWVVVTLGPEGVIDLHPALFTDQGYLVAFIGDSFSGGERFPVDALFAAPGGPSPTVIPFGTRDGSYFVVLP